MTVDSQDYLAYRAAVRHVARRERALGLIACLVGVIVLIWGRTASNAPSWAVVAGLVTIAAGWSLFAYVLIRRTRYVRAHPYHPQS
jgi:drug/metabolite transporter (DMT)-like permease